MQVSIWGVRVAYYVFLVFVQPSNCETETAEVTRMLIWVDVLVYVLKCEKKSVFLKHFSSSPYVAISLVGNHLGFGFLYL